MTILSTHRGNTEVQFIGFTMEACCNCGIPFMIPTYLYNKLQSSGASFYCPNGHGQHYTKTKEMELREKLEQEKKEKKMLQEESKHWQDLWEKKINENKKLKAEKKRIEKRAKSGVCLCCNRSFRNILQHMKTKHPENQNGKQKKVNSKTSNKLIKK